MQSGIPIPSYAFPGQPQPRQRRHRAAIRFIRSWWPTEYCAIARRQRETCVALRRCRGPDLRIQESRCNSRRTVATRTSSLSSSSASFFAPPRKARSTALPVGVRPDKFAVHKGACQHRSPFDRRHQKSKSIRQPPELRLVVNQVHRDRRGVGNRAPSPRPAPHPPLPSKLPAAQAGDATITAS